MLKCKQCNKEWVNGLIVETPDRESLYFCAWRCLMAYAAIEFEKEFKSLLYKGGADANPRQS